MLTIKFPSKLQNSCLSLTSNVTIINKAMKTNIKQEKKVVELSKLVPYENNPNIHPEEQVKALAESMDEYGQYYPIIVDENMKILCGHGKKLALELLGEKKGEVTIMHGLSEKQKLRIVVEDNKIQSMSYIDFTKIEQIIREIGETKVIGFTTEYLEAIIKENVPDNMGVDFQEPAIKQQKFTDEKQQEDVQERNDIEEGMQTAHTIVCPHCGKEITL